MSQWEEMLSQVEESLHTLYRAKDKCGEDLEHIQSILFEFDSESPALEHIQAGSMALNSQYERIKDQIEELQAEKAVYLERVAEEFRIPY